jgi:hypothetical protein
MSQAFTPGLKRKTLERITKKRVLPIEGEVLVKKGERVTATQSVARTLIPGKVHSYPLAPLLGVQPMENIEGVVRVPYQIEKYLLKKLGEPVLTGEVIAENKYFFGLFKKTFESPIDGVVDTYSNYSGSIFIREKPEPIEIPAYIPGKITEVFPSEGVTVETLAAIIQGILGVGGEAHGELRFVVGSTDELVTVDKIDDECNGKILVGGLGMTEKALQKAVEVGASAVIVGGMPRSDLSSFMGYEIGVAITGHEELGLTLIITEGFGHIRMSANTFKLLKRFEGQLACVNGATQIRAGVVRPEIIIPRLELDVETTKIDDKADLLVSGLVIGTLVRVISEPYFGMLGKITHLPVEPQSVETGSYVRVLEVELETGEQVIVPRANVEIIEE